jgi:hypothetical protein
MRIKKSFLLLFLGCFFYANFSFSQNLITRKAQPLSVLLKNAEIQFQIKFSYVDKDIKTITLLPYPKKLALTQVIQYFKNNTPLTFTILNDKNILINKPILKNSICGYLTDFNTKQKIEGAHINILNTKIHIVSSFNGYFFIKNVAENAVIEISHISYPTVFLNSNDFLTQKKCQIISLTQKIQQLPEIVISNFLTSGISLKTDNSFYINLPKSGILPGLIEPDVLQKIKVIPGISSVNETVSNINIRGGTTDENLLLWDGIKMYHSGHFFGLISTFNPYLTKSVTVIKNGTNPQYNDGVSGTIKIESLDKVNKTVFAGAGFNLLSADAYAYIPISKKAGIQFSGRRSTTDWLKTPTFTQYFNKAFQDSKITSNTISEENITKNSSFNFFDYSFKFLYNFNENNHIRVNFLRIENGLDYKELLSDETSFSSKTSTLEQENIVFGIQLKSKWSSKLNTFLQAYLTKYTNKASNFSLLTDQRLLQNNIVLETGVKFNTNYQINKNLSVLSGYHFYELGVTNSDDVNLPLFIRTIKNVTRNHSLYSQIKYNSNNYKTFVNGGIRLNYINKFSLFLAEPRIQVLQKLTPLFSIKLGGEFKSQNITQVVDLQEDFLGVAKSRWTLADNNKVPIIKSKQASVGFNYKENSLLIDLELFIKKVNGITSSNQGFQNQFQFVKTYGNYQVKGIEFLINKKINNSSVWLGYTFNDNQYTFNDLTPKSFPNNLNIKHNISLGSTYTYKKLNIAIGIHWRTGKPYTVPLETNPIINNGISNSINYSLPNNKNLKNYLRTDFSATYSFKFNKKVNGFIGASLLNAFNNNNILNTYFKANADGSVTQVNNNSIGITPNFTFRVTM